VVFNATFNNMLYHGDQFSWWRRPEQPEKTTDLSCIKRSPFSCPYISLYAGAILVRAATLQNEQLTN
jgi:hypothetical protein